ncbi:hypothetical protein CEXT_530071 [Caerostris extrusa]|uniref:Uncharacterized protein n=1 Tax=Caerostris extrusa TaxID=172846 RepID=A0AAV4TNG9_CAEEX|nr:hypothetical protein CEXT_530071 [Caerostris extrusa]
MRIAQRHRCTTFSSIAVTCCRRQLGVEPLQHFKAPGEQKTEFNPPTDLLVRTICMRETIQVRSWILLSTTRMKNFLRAGKDIAGGLDLEASEKNYRDMDA